MELKDLTQQKVFLSGQANKICKLINNSLDGKRMDKSYREVINRVVVDYANEEIIDKDERMLRLYYLALSLRDSMIWNKGVGTNVYFRKPAMKLIRDFQDFARKKGMFINVQEAPNVIIHDYIACVELKGKDFVEFYLSKHLIQSI